MYKKCSFSLVAPDTADFLTSARSYWLGLEIICLEKGRKGLGLEKIW